MKKVTCPKCSSEARKTVEQYVYGSSYRHRWYRCTNPDCMITWDQDQRLKEIET